MPKLRKAIFFARKKKGGREREEAALQERNSCSVKSCQTFEEFKAKSFCSVIYQLHLLDCLSISYPDRDEKQGIFAPIAIMRGIPEKRDKNKYCRYHMDHGYDTKDC